MLTTCDSLLAVLILHINTKTNHYPNSNPTSILYYNQRKKTWRGALFR